MTETTYRVVCEDNGYEIEPPPPIAIAIGSFSGLTEAEAKKKIRCLTATFERWTQTKADDSPEVWKRGDRLVSCRLPGNRVRTYSISPEWFLRETGL